MSSVQSKERSPNKLTSSGPLTSFAAATGTKIPVQRSSASEDKKSICKLV